MADLVAIQSGFSDDPNTFGGTVPGDGDRINKNGFDITFRTAQVVGTDDGQEALFDSNFNTAGNFIFADGCDLISKGGIGVDNSRGIHQSNSVVTLETSSAAQAFDYTVGDFGGAGDFSIEASATEAQPARLVSTGPGVSRINIKTDGSVNVNNLRVEEFGSATVPAMNCQFADQAHHKFYCRNFVFQNCRGFLDLHFYGEDNMGDIDIDGLFFVDPAGSLTNTTSNIRIDGATGPSVDYTTTNVRKINNVRCQGSVEGRYFGGYETNDWRYSGNAVLATNLSKGVVSQDRWFAGDHQGTFLRAMGDMTEGYFRDLGDNGHGISIARLRTANPVLQGLIFDTRNSGGSDTNDFFATDAANDTEDMLVPGQVVRLQENILLGNPNATVNNDGTRFLTCNGLLSAGDGQVANTISVELIGNVGRFSRGGGVFTFDEAGTTPTKFISGHKNNIWDNYKGDGDFRIARSLSTVPVTDLIDPAGSDNNSYRNFPDRFGVPTTGTFGVDYDVNSINATDPEFNDPDRNLEGWARFVHNVSEEQVVENLIKAGVLGVSAAEYSVFELVCWVRDGFYALESDHETGSDTGSNLGTTDSALPVLVVSVSGSGAQTIRIGETQVVSLDRSATATSVSVHDGQGNAESAVLNTKPSSTEESITLPAKGKLVFGGPDGFFLVFDLA